MAPPDLPPRPQLPPQLRMHMPPQGTPILLSRQQKLDFTEQLFRRWAQLTGMTGWDIDIRRDADGLSIRINAAE